VNPFRLILLAGALLLLEALIGGTRLVFALPGFALIAIAALTFFFGKPEGLAQPKWHCVVTTFLVFGWIVFRAFTSPVPYLARPDLYQVIACLLMYGAFAWFCTQTRERLWIFGFLLLLAIVQVFVGIRQFKYGDDWMPLNLGRAPYGHRASGFFVHSIHFAGYLEAIGVIALSLACWARWRLEARVATGFAALLCYVGVAISGSRGGYMSVAFSLLVFFVLSLWMLARMDRRKFGITLVAGVVAFVLAGSIVTGLMSRSQFLRARLAMLNEQFEGKWDIRIYNWQAALDQFSVSPVIGTGSGTHLYSGRFFRRPQIQSDPVHAHSDYLELLAEYGAVGGGLMALFLGSHLLSGLRGASRILKRDMLPVGESRDDNLALQIGLLSAVAAYIAHSAVDFNMHIPSNALLFSIIFGCLAQPRPVAPEQARPWGPGAVVPRVVLPAIALWMLGIAVYRLPGEYWTEETRKALRDRKFQAVPALASKAIRYDPRNPDAYFYQGEAYRIIASAHNIRTLRRTPFEQAVVAYDTSLRAFPQDENVWVRRGQALAGLQRFADAETSFLTAIQLDTNLGALYGYYAQYLRRVGREEEAEKQLRRGAELKAVNLERILLDSHDVHRLPLPGATDQ
jgi:O-antigen ligase